MARSVISNEPIQRRIRGTGSVLARAGRVRRERSAPGPGWSRVRATIATAGLVWLLGLAAVFSFNLWRDFTPLDMIPQLRGRTVFSILDYAVSNFVLPLNAMLIALLAGWAISGKRMREDIGFETDAGWRLWQVSVRILAPVALFAVFLSNIWT